MMTKHADFSLQEVLTHSLWMPTQAWEFNHSHMYTLSATLGRAVTEAHIRLKREKREGTGGCIRERHAVTVNKDSIAH